MFEKEAKDEKYANNPHFQDIFMCVFNMKIEFESKLWFKSYFARNFFIATFVILDSYNFKI